MTPEEILLFQVTYFAFVVNLINSLKPPQELLETFGFHLGFQINTRRSFSGRKLGSSEEAALDLNFLLSSAMLAGKHGRQKYVSWNYAVSCTTFASWSFKCIFCSYDKCNFFHCFQIIFGVYKSN